MDLIPRMVRLGGAEFLTAMLALTLAPVAPAGRGYIPATTLTVAWLTVTWWERAEVS